MTRITYYCILFLTLYIPFEEFIEKWLPSNLIYDLARYGGEILLLALLILVTTRKILSKGYLLKTPTDVPILAFLGIAFISTIFNQSLVEISILGMRPLIRYWMLFYIFAQIDFTSHQYKKLLGAMLSSAIVVSIVGLMQTIVGLPLTTLLIPKDVVVGDTIVRAGLRHIVSPRTYIFSTLGRYDTLGTYITFFILTAFGIYLFSKKRLKSRSFFLLLIGFPVLALTFSRQSWLGTLLGIGIILLLGNGKKIWSLRAAAFIILSFSIIGISILLPNARYLGTYASSQATLSERLLEPFSKRYIEVSRNNYGRLYVIFDVGKSLLETSPLIGIGPGKFGSITAQFFGYDFASIVNVPEGAANLINDVNWITMFGQIGILGVMSFLWIWISLAIFSWTTFRRTTDSLTKGLALGYLSIIIVFLISGFFGPNFEVRQISFFVWGMGGLLFGLFRNEKLTNSLNAYGSREKFLRYENVLKPV